MKTISQIHRCFRASIALSAFAAMSVVWAQAEYERAKTEIEKIDAENRNATQAIAAIQTEFGSTFRGCQRATPDGSWESLRKMLEQQREDLERAYFETQKLAQSIERHRITHIETFRKEIEDDRANLSAIAYEQKLDEYGKRINFEYVAFFRTFVFPAYNDYVSGIRTYYSSMGVLMAACNSGENRPQPELAQAPARIEEVTESIRKKVAEGSAQLADFG